jgi:GTP-binding protein
MAGVDNRKHWDDYEILLNELACYDEELGARTKIVVANKMDAENSKENLKEFKGLFPDINVFEMSALEGIGFDELVDELQKIIISEN